MTDCVLNRSNQVLGRCKQASWLDVARRLRGRTALPVEFALLSEAPRAHLPTVTASGTPDEVIRARLARAAVPDIRNVRPNWTGEQARRWLEVL